MKAKHIIIATVLIGVAYLVYVNYDQLSTQAFLPVQDSSYSEGSWEELDSAQVEKEFLHFMAKHRKSYGTKEEYKFRLDLFTQAYQEVMTHDAEAAGFTKELNKFADMSKLEYQMMLGVKGRRPAEQESVITHFSSSDLPESVDWRDAEAIGPVRNQGQCGACWAFSSIGAIAALYRIEYGTLHALSEQQLIDCSTGKEYGNNGCNGGWATSGFKYATDHSIMKDEEYPFIAHDDECHNDESKGVVQIIGFSDVVPNDPEQLKAAIARQPVTVSLDASSSFFQFYAGGIIDSEKCGTDLTHSVLAVGYGIENSTEYLILKNSWGANWGEGGYVRVSLTPGKGTCGVNQDASFPTFFP